MRSSVAHLFDQLRLKKAITVTRCGEFKLAIFGFNPFAALTITAIT
ncbi:hypothetical protein RJJ65_39745 [Rhizobium hidalgonense]|uniref:Uncharacterized protein n=1 Tax=Rhizobium hidalgonense TaxID=1538159 RepID=A0AAJ2LNH9_9HYPH|nr:hypothetical protein [Rhizobium hidalgonense]MDR9778680.1 hypothetical protein [Rhizobium hidalgonense]